MLEIIFEDEFIIVCKKMSGIPTQTPKSGVTDMVSLLKNYRVSKGEPPYIGLVHRLDQPVEGVMVFAKDKKSAAALSAQMQAHTFEKYYYAMVEGTFSPACGTLGNYLLRDGKSNVSSVVPKDTTGAKRAELSYETVKTMEDRSLVRIQLKTGRHHQIRVQLSERGFPLVGDVKYGGPRCGDGLKLHAVRLRVGKETYTALPPWAGPWRVAHLPPEWEDA